jgi:hypothetical protein
MSSTRFRVIFVLLILILLAASILFAVLTYWVGAEAEPGSVPSQGNMNSAGRRCWRHLQVLELEVACRPVGGSVAAEASSARLLSGGNQHL